MAAEIQSRQVRGFRRQLDYHGEECTLTRADGSTVSLTVMFEEQVGAVDDQERTTISFVAADSGDVARGDYLVKDGETLKWYLIDVRINSGIYEIRCDRKLKRL